MFEQSKLNHMIDIEAFDIKSRPRVISPWRIRNDTTNMILYKCITSSITYKILSPLEALIVPFLNGENTIGEIYKYWLDIHSTKKVTITRLSKLFNQTINTLLNSEFVEDQGEISPTFTDNKSTWIPNFSDYNSHSLRLERPISVNFEITNHCTSNCRYCYAERLLCNELDLDQLKSLFDEFSKNEIYIVDIGGADIFARPDSMNILTEMVKRDFIFFTSTKCHISKERAEGLAALGIGIKDVPPHLERAFQISIDSADNEMASFLVRRKDYLKSTVTSVENCINTGIYPKIKCVLTSFNADAPRGLVEKFANMGITEFQFVQYGRSYFRHDESLFLSLEDKMSLIETADLLRKEYPEISFTFQEDVNTEDILNKSKEQWDSRSICSGGRTSMLLKPNGDVILCEQIPHKPQFVMGNLVQQSLEDLWHSKKINDFLFAPKELFKDTACEKCLDFEKCHYEKGYCYRDALFNYNTIYEAPSDCPFQSKPGIRMT